MSTILQPPCLESQFMETPNVLTLKVAASKAMEFGRSSIENSDEFNQLKIKNFSPNTTEHGGWSFLQVLSNISSTPTETMEKENLYIHPLSKSASSRLSEKSLQLCTENLGCETGCFITDNNIMSLSSYNYPMENPARKEQKQKQAEGYSFSYSIKKVKSSHTFPPPLTTMSGEKSLQIRSNREGGRLVIKAVEIPLKESCFLADRSDGRLRLCLLKGFGTKADVQVSTEENEAENEDGGGDIEHVNEMKNEDEPGENEESENQEGEEGEEEGDDDNERNYKEMMSDEFVGGNYDSEVQSMGKEKFNRLGRCKECGHSSNKELSHWEPLFVATS